MRARLATIGAGAVSVAVLLGIWQGVCALGIVSPDYLPPPSRVATALVELARDGTLIQDNLLTMARALGGLIAATILGVGMAAVTTRYRKGALAFDPVAEFIRPLPPAAIIPLSIFVFGLRWQLYAFIITFACFWPIYLNAARAMHSSSRLQVQTARSFGVDGWALLGQVQLVAALPEIFIGIRQAGAVSLVATIVTEMLAGQNGIGFLITDASMTLQVPETFAGLVVIMADGVLLDAAIMALRRRFVAWHDGMNAVRT